MMCSSYRASIDMKKTPKIALAAATKGLTKDLRKVVPIRSDYQRGYDDGVKAEQNALVSNHYEVNVSRLVKDHRGSNYHHYFATTERSIHTKEQLEKVMEDFNQRFPKPEFNVMASAVYQFKRTVEVE